MFILFIVFLSCQTEPRQISLAEVKGYYNDLFSVRLSKSAKQTSYYYAENNLPTDHPFYSFVKKYPLYLEYLLWNHTTHRLLEPLMDETDSVLFNTRWLEIVKTDSIFNGSFLPIAHAYLKSKNIIVKDYTPPQIPVLTEKEFNLIASRFFYGELIDSAKRIQWRICIGVNPYRTDSSLRKYPAVEGFCFAAILNSKDYSYFYDYDTNIEKIGFETKSLSDSIKLGYARQRMIEEMMKSKHLQQLLRKKYKAGKDELAFIVK